MNTLLMLMAVGAIALLYETENASAVCCRKACKDHCMDGSIGTPYCGKGPCNIFGCNCPSCWEGNCREQCKFFWGVRHGCKCVNCGRKKRSIEDESIDDISIQPNPIHSDLVRHKRSAEALFQEADLNGDGRLVLDEYTRAHVRVRKSSETASQEFNNVDANMDGFISKAEALK